jgi:Dynamin family
MNRETTQGEKGRKQAHAGIRVWKRLARLNRALNRINGILPRHGEAGAIRPTLSALEIRLALSFRLGNTSEIFDLLALCRMQLQRLSHRLDHRLRKLEWIFPYQPMEFAGKGIMSKSLIYLRDEVRRQISLTIAILEEARGTRSGVHTNASLIRETETGEVRHFDREDLERVLRVLRDEVVKVERFEYRLLILGTMKAGKTTTIAGITGVSVLPVRTEAMTTLPTLVRSETGRAIPTMNLRQAAKVRSFFDDIRCGKVVIPDNKTDLLNHGARDAYTRIRNGANLPAMPLDGETGIRETISLLNDGLRIAEVAGEGSRYMEAFMSSDDLPVIDVEFSSLSGVATRNDLGRIVLVDSPGPNEAAHSDSLLKVVKEQIDRASALVVVKNYTVLDGTDEEQMRALVESTAERTDKERNILLLNRYDDAKRGQDPSPQQKQDDLARKYPAFDSKRIFAVSAERAATSSRLLRVLNESGAIDDQLLLDSFGAIAFGMEYREQDASFRDPQRLRAMIPRVWGLSFYDTIPVDGRDFREPVDTEVTFLSCLRELSQNAARHCIGSALQTLEGNNVTLRKFLQYRGQLEEDDISALTIESEQIAADIFELERQRDVLNVLIEQAMVELEAELDQQSEELLDHVQAELDRVFSHNSRKAEEALEKPEREASFVSRIMDFFKMPETIGRGYAEERLYAPIELKEDITRQLKYNTSKSSRTEADKFQNALEASISTFVQEQCAVCHQRINASVKALEYGVKQHVEAVMKATLDKARARLGVAFTRDLTIELEADLNEATSAGVGIRAPVEVHHREYYVTVDQAGVLGEAKRWFGELFEQPQWGRTEELRTSVSYELDTEKLKEIHFGRVIAFQTKLREIVSGYVSEYLKSEVHQYHHEMASYLEAYRTTISDTLSDHALDVQERKALKGKILSLHERVDQLVEDIREAIEVHLAKKQVAA